MTMTSENVELRFCDLCGKSIPEKEFAAGMTRMAGDKLVGACCLAPLGLGEQLKPKPAEGAAAGGRNVVAFALVATVLAIASVLGAALWLDGRARARDARERIATLEGKIGSLQSAFADSEKDAAASRATMPVRIEEKIAVALKPIDTRLVALGDAMPKGDTGIVVVKGMLNKLQGYVTDLSARQARVESGLAAHGVTLQRELAVVARSLVDLRRAKLAAPRVASSASGGPSDTNVRDGASSSKKPEALPDKLGKRVDELSSDNAGVRWEAVDELLRSGDRRVVAYVIPRLKDDDPFVRRLVAESLPRAADIEVCGELIAALDDRESIVREAAHKSLVKLSRQNFPFDPEASERARRAQVGTWAKWWKNRS